MNNHLIDQIHKQAQTAVQKFKQSEVELLNALEQCEKHRVHVVLGYSSLFTYATGGLGLSEEVAYIYINVARKSREVPALKVAIAEGSITVSKASRLTRVMNKDNHTHWLEVAKKSTKRELEKLIATENPRVAVSEKIGYVSADRVEMTVGLSEKLMIRLRRAQDVISQKRRRPVSLEEVLELVTDEYLRREDPIEIAERQLAKGKLANTVQSQQSQHQSTKLGPGRPRRPLANGLRHRVYLKFNGQCAHQTSSGERCSERRFLDVHHIQPLHRGGQDRLENLELLCSGHHKARHDF